jgi:N utilization substance protein B
MSESAAPRKPVARNLGGHKRSLARLAAVQALYQIELNAVGASEGALDTVIREFVSHRFEAGGGEEEVDFSETDRALFADVVKGVAARREALDGMIAAALPEDWPLDRLESVLRAILRAGAYELWARADIPVRVVISEYIDVAHAFFFGKEPGMVNAILDRLGRQLRTEIG